MKAPMEYGIYTYSLVLLLRVQVLCTVHKVLYISRDPVTRYSAIYASTVYTYCTVYTCCVGMSIYSAFSAIAHESMYAYVPAYALYVLYHALHVLYSVYIGMHIPWIMGPNTDIPYPMLSMYLSTYLYMLCIRCVYAVYVLSVYHVFSASTPESMYPYVL